MVILNTISSYIRYYLSCATKRTNSESEHHFSGYFTLWEMIFLTQF